MLNIYVFLIINLIFVAFTSTAIVKWVPNKSFSLPINFSNQKLPCSKETVVFPSIIEEAVKMDGQTYLNELILPTDGLIILNSGLIEFGVNPNDKNCTEEIVYYATKAESWWNDPDVWNSTRFNEATPDAERMPCFDDIVEFPTDAEYTINMPQDAPVQRVKELRGYVTSSSYEQHQIFNYFYPWTIVISPLCKVPNGCACQLEPIPVNCELKMCKKPNCVAPIKPEGNCCPICGGEIIFKASHMFNFKEYKDFVGKAVDSYGGSRLAYHVGKLTDGRVQVVIVNKDDYDGTSSQVANVIGHSMEEQWMRGALHEAVSGSPASKAGLGGRIAVSMFFAVVITMAALYLYYYKLPAISIPTLTQYPRATISRVYRRTDSVVTLTKRDSDTLDEGEPSATSFRNPLYDSKRGRSDAME